MAMEMQILKEKSQTLDTSFIDEAKISQLLEDSDSQAQDSVRVREIIAKARKAKGLEPEEVAVLLQVEADGLLEEMYDVTHEIKMNIYGKRVVLFAPLYLSNYCVNSCRYCGYHRNNKEMKRKRLMREEIREEIKYIEAMGHKRIVIETGEDPVHSDIDYVVDAIKTIYDTANDNGVIRRVNVNIAATTVENYRKLKAAKIGTYTLFQETYHRNTYKKMHTAGPKSDYDYHLTAMHRAIEAGIDDVGIGVLYGLYDYKFEVLATFFHALHLEEKFGVGPHTISIPRLRPAVGSDVNIENYPYLISDKEFKKIAAIIRLAVPYTGMILSTRETPEMRDELIQMGISQMSAGSCTGVGSYKKEYGEHDHTQEKETAQFVTSDHRSPDQVIRGMLEAGYIPSFCTGCYRKGRTGGRFMPLAKSGKIKDVCQLNALLTLKEYLLDYAKPETKAVGEQLIQHEIDGFEAPEVREAMEAALVEMVSGKRDIYH